MSGIEARDIIEAELRRELFGPLESDHPVGKPIDCSSGSIRFEMIEDSRGRFYDRLFAFKGVGVVGGVGRVVVV